MNRIEVTTLENTRIDSWLDKNLPDFSRTLWQKQISKEMVRVNGVIIKANYKVKLGDIIEYEDIVSEPMNLEPVEMDLDIVYEDDDLLVINKPKGLVVHPGNGTIEPTLVSGLLAHCQNLSNINGETRPGIVHRIDKDTTGLLIVAKNDKAHRFLADQLQDKSLSRNYLALVYDNNLPDSGTIDAPIGRDPRERTRMKVTPENSKEAVTHFTTLKRYKNTALVECRLETGRTHQIRVHMSYIKHPIVGDPVYGKKKDELATSQVLHAYKITFIHPTSKERMTFEIGLPKEFQELLDQLDKENAQ